MGPELAALHRPRRDSRGALRDRDIDPGDFGIHIDLMLHPVGDTVYVRLEQEADDTSPLGNPYYFTGRRLDVIPVPGDPRQIYHYRARNYDPFHGRFMQRDPSGYVDGMNLYEYAASNPLRYTDPTGHRLRALPRRERAYGGGFTFDGFRVPKTGYEWTFQFEHRSDDKESRASKQVDQNVTINIFFYDEKGHPLLVYLRMYGEWFALSRDPGKPQVSRMTVGEDIHKLRIATAEYWEKALKEAKRRRSGRVERVRIHASFTAWPVSGGVGGPPPFGYYQFLPLGDEAFEQWSTGGWDFEDVLEDDPNFWKNRNLFEGRAVSRQLHLPTTDAEKAERIADWDIVEWKRNPKTKTYDMSYFSTEYGRKTYTGMP